MLPSLLEICVLCVSIVAVGGAEDSVALFQTELTSGAAAEEAALHLDAKRGPPGGARVAVRNVEADDTKVDDQPRDERVYQIAWKPTKSASMSHMQFAVPVLAILSGICLSFFEQARLVGKLCLFFGAQTFMNLYMKSVLSKSTVSVERNLYGFPAALCVTAMQQTTGFVLLVLLIALSWATPWAYYPKRLTRKKDFAMLVLFSLCFTLNIALNNFSLSVMDLSLNLVIRSVGPMVTLCTQCFVDKLVFGKAVNVKMVELALIIAGVIGAALTVYAKAGGMQSLHGDKGMVILGTVLCGISLWPGAMELILASFLGESLRLNSIDMALYMAIPSTLILLLPIFLIPHTISWTGYSAPITDFAILKEVISMSPWTFFLAILSGCLAIFYNMLLYAVVQTLSAAYTGFTGNFNKGATIALSFIFGSELLPLHPWGTLVVVGIVLNLGSFTSLGLLKTYWNRRAAKAAKADSK